MAQPKFPVRKLLSTVVNWFGRQGQANITTTSQARRPIARDSNGNTTCINTPTYWEMFLTPYIFAGVRFRDISRLWTGAAPTKNDAGQINSQGQIQALDDDGNESDSEQLQATRWLFDEHITPDMKQTLEQISYAKIIEGKAVQEILWTRASDGPYAGKIIFDGFKDIDPELFEFNPVGYEPGLYLKRPVIVGGNAVYEKVDERRFLVVTNHKLYDDPNGISELEPLKKAERRREIAESDWGRGIQRVGRGHIIGRTGPLLRGEQAKEARELFREALEEMSSDTITMMDENNNVEVIQPSLQNDAFRDFQEELKTQISLVLTGSPATLKEGKFGNYSMAEATNVRQESELEQADCADIASAFTEQVIRRFCDFNWASTEVYPYMQLITEELITPTISEAQLDQTQDVMADATETAHGEKAEQEPEEEPKKEIVKESIFSEYFRGVKKFQEEQEPVEKTPPMAIPVGYKEFPNTTPIPQTVKDEIDTARDVLADMPVKEYSGVQPNEAPFVFTIKRFRGFQADMLPILTALKTALDITLDADTEEEAWKEYYEMAVTILKANGIDMTPQIRDNLNISFRQARQNVFNEAIYRRAMDDPAVVGLRIVNQPSDHHHPVHTFWDGVAIPKEHPELQRGGRLRIPMDFGCICQYEYVRNAAEITAESAWPEVYPGESYKYYAQPDERLPETQEAR
jgi:hypothetical protein